MPVVLLCSTFFFVFISFDAYQLGLSVVPALPYLFDKPVEEAVEWAFRTLARAYGGADAVPQLHAAPHKHQATSTTTAAAADGVKKQLDSEAEKLKASAAVSWEEFKQEKIREKEERRRESHAKRDGEGGILGWWARSKRPSDSTKDKTE